MGRIEGPYYPIIYVRGFAMTRGEIDTTTATRYMGFNQGATKDEGKKIRASSWFDATVSPRPFRQPRFPGCRVNWT